MIWIELLVLLACILIGARFGGLALGTIAGIGLAIFVFGFAMPPGGPPRAVIGMIIAVITALATMQARRMSSSIQIIGASPRPENGGATATRQSDFGPTAEGGMGPRSNCPAPRPVTNIDPATEARTWTP